MVQNAAVDLLEGGESDARSSDSSSKSDTRTSNKSNARNIDKSDTRTSDKSNARNIDRSGTRTSDKSDTRTSNWSDARNGDRRDVRTSNFSDVRNSPPILSKVKTKLFSDVATRMTVAEAATTACTTLQACVSAQREHCKSASQCVISSPEHITNGCRKAKTAGASPPSDRSFTSEHKKASAVRKESLPGNKSTEKRNSQMINLNLSFSDSDIDDLLFADVEALSTTSRVSELPSQYSQNIIELDSVLHKARAKRKRKRGSASVASASSSVIDLTAQPPGDRAGAGVGAAKRRKTDCIAATT